MVRARLCVVLEMGTGKSKIVVDTIGLLREVGEVNVSRLWQSMVNTTGFARRSPRIAGPHRADCAGNRTSPKYKSEFDFIESDALKIFVMNVEAFSTQKGAVTAKWFGEKFGERGMMVVDESTTIKNQFAVRRCAAGSISMQTPADRLPCDKSPMDQDSQCEFLGNQYLGFPSYYAFQVLCRGAAPVDGSPLFPRDVGFQPLDELNGKLDGLAKSVEEGMSRPAREGLLQEVELTDDQKTYYRQMALAQAQLQMAPSSPQTTS